MIFFVYLLFLKVFRASSSNFIMRLRILRGSVSGSVSSICFFSMLRVSGVFFICVTMGSFVACLPIHSADSKESIDRSSNDSVLEAGCLR